MKSILIVCDLVPVKYGAFEHFLVGTARYAGERGVAVHYLFPGEPIAAVAADLRAAGVGWTVEPDWKTADDRLNLRPFVGAVRQLARAHPWDVIQFHFCAELPTLLALAQWPGFARHRARVMWFQHSEIRPARGVAQWASRIRLMGQFADALVVNTTAGRRELIRRGCPPHKVELLPNAVPGRPPDRPCDLRSQLGLPEAVKLAVCVGSLIPRKGYDVLLPAFAEATRDRPDWHLVIAGDGPERAAVTALAEQLLPGRVHLLGLVERVPDVLAECDLFALATRSETLTLAVIEAMMAGLPVVTTSVGGHGDLIQSSEHGLLVPAGDARSLALALRKLIESPEAAAEMGRRAADVARANFGLERRLALWFKMLDSRSRRPV